MAPHQGLEVFFEMSIVITEIVDRGPAGRWRDMWPVEHVDALRKYHATGKLSCNEMAAAINGDFKTDYSRNAIIGKCKRVGLASKHKIGWAKGKPRKASPQPRPARTERETFRPAPPREQMRCAAVEPGHVCLIDLAPDGCRYPFGDGPFTFCNAPQFPDRSYCAYHLSLTMREG
jgi:GcrA cell cycle regulator